MADNVTIIGAETQISGEIRGDQKVLVRGRISGRVSITSTLTVEDGAVVQADVEAETVSISGAVVGNVTATDHVRLFSKARVVGDLTAPRIIMDGGAAYRGRVDMGDATAGTSASRAARRSDSQDRVSERPATRVPPKAPSPSRASTVSGPVASRTQQRPAAASRPAPPKLPRVSSSGAARASWSKKKLHKRR